MGDQARGGLLSAYLERQRWNAAVPHMRGSVLDFGCGAGRLAARVPGTYVGVDADPDALRIAQRLNASATFVDSLPTDRRFDTIVILAVIEHVEDPAATLRELASLLTPQGRIVLTTPRPFSRVIHDTGAMLGLFSREAAEEHQHFLGRSEITTAARAAGLDVQHYERFLLGINQLAILVRKNP